MKKSVIFLLHLGFWTCYFVLIGIMLGLYYRGMSTGAEPVARMVNAFKNLFFFALIPSFLTFYSFYFILFPKFLQQKKMVPSIANGLFYSAIAALVGYTLLRLSILFGGMNDMDRNGNSPQIKVVAVMACIGLISGIVALVIKGFITWFEEIKLREELMQKNHETEMALVKAQLDPHFLFNTLNNIDVLILKNAEEASTYLNKLSDILRFMLYETKTDHILLSKELEYIGKYIELQKIRTSNTNYVYYNVTGATGHKTIAPMIFIPFIENAFKHTHNKKLDHAITVSIEVEEGKIVFACENKVDPARKTKQAANGLGNELIRKRLLLLYPEKHTLKITNQNERYSVQLIIYG